MARKVHTFYYNLSTMLDAGLPITRALTVTTQTCSYDLRKPAKKIVKSVSQGKSLSEALSEFPKFFEPLDISAIQAAEESGSLPEILKMLADSHEFFQKIIKKITTALIFPFIILLIAAFIIPLIPYLLGSITLIQSFFWTIKILCVYLIPALIAYIIIKYTPKTGPLRYALDFISLVIPILRKGLEHIAISRFCYTFHLLFKAGVPIIRTVEISVKAVTNLVVANRFRGGIKKAQTGHDISEGFKKPLPFGFIDLWKTGEESGQLDLITKKLADMNSEIALHKLDRFAFWFPRFIYVLVCLMIVAAIFRYAGNVYDPFMSLE